MTGSNSGNYFFEDGKHLPMPIVEGSMLVCITSVKESISVGKVYTVERHGPTGYPVIMSDKGHYVLGDGASWKFVSFDNGDISDYF